MFAKSGGLGHNGDSFVVPIPSVRLRSSRALLLLVSIYFSVISLPISPLAFTFGLLYRRQVHFYSKQTQLCPIFSGEKHFTGVVAVVAPAYRVKYGGSVVCPERVLTDDCLWWSPSGVCKIKWVSLWAVVELAGVAIEAVSGCAGKEPLSFAFGEVVGDVGHDQHSGFRSTQVRVD